MRTDRDGHGKNPWRVRDPRTLNLIAVVVLAAFAVIVWRTAPDRVTQRDDAGFLELLLRAPVVLGAARVALVLAAAYVVLSVVWLIAAGQPLIKFGPAEAAPLLDEAGEEAERLRERVAALTEERDRFLEDARNGWEVAHALAARFGAQAASRSVEKGKIGE